MHNLCLLQLHKLLPRLSKRSFVTPVLYLSFKQSLFVTRTSEGILYISLNAVCLNILQFFCFFQLNNKRSARNRKYKILHLILFCMTTKFNNDQFIAQCCCQLNQLFDLSTSSKYLILFNQYDRI